MLLVYSWTWCRSRTSEETKNIAALWRTSWKRPVKGTRSPGESPSRLLVNDSADYLCDILTSMLQSITQAFCKFIKSCYFLIGVLFICLFVCFVCVVLPFSVHCAQALKFLESRFPPASWPGILMRTVALIKCSAPPPEPYHSHW